MYYCIKLQNLIPYYRVFGKLKVVGYILNDNVNRTNFDERKGVCITACG